MITTNDPAAPYAEVVALFPRYNPIPALPMENSRLVARAPTHTSRHLSFTSGKTLNMAANSAAMTRNETAKPAMCTNVLDNQVGNILLIQVPAAERIALRARDMSS